MTTRLSKELVLFGVLLPVWFVAFGLFVAEALQGGPPQTHLLVRPPEGPAAYPRVQQLRPGVAPQPGGVAAGDELVRIGQADLRGAMPWTVYAQLYHQARDGAVEVELVRGGETRTVTERLVREGDAVREIVLCVAFMTTVLLLLPRAPSSQMLSSFALATLMWTFIVIHFQGARVEQTYAYLGLRSIAGCLWAPLMIRAVFRFPEGAWPRGKRLPLWPWVFLFLGLTWTSKWLGMPFSTEFGIRANPAIGSLVMASLLVIATLNYQKATALGRRQVRWVMFGAYLGIAPVLLGDLAAALRPGLAEWWHASQFALVAIPISIFIAVTQSNMLDIDRLISGTASYTILLVVLGAGALTVVPWAAEEASARAAIDPLLTQLALGAVVAFCVIRLEPRLRPYLERTFFSERHALQTGIDRLVADLANAPDATTVARLVGERLETHLRPASCVIYARGDEAFAPVSSAGSVVTPHFDLDSPLLAALAERSSAVDLERARELEGRASPADRAALGSLAAAVLLPVTHGRDLAAFIALGRKGSGDIYTPTDLALLGVVGASVAGSLARFGGEELLDEARNLQERLRQYVPASIAAQLAEGRELEAGERVVSVLFADLRGYATLAEGRRAEEIFSTVSQYTEAVTRAVSRHGGTVVEFNGDGMMAVFGAPEPIPDKEKRALSAARDIVADVRQLGGLGGSGRLEVGVGLATGSAYVGAIRSVDRYIWSAIGNTTNLAARLQGLSKDFEAPIVIDEATWRRGAGSDARFDAHPESRIRGLREPQDLYSLSHDRLEEA